MKKYFVLIGVLLVFISAGFKSLQQHIAKNLKSIDDTEIIISTFLGDEQRNYYGNKAPENLKVVWKHYLGKGETTLSRKSGSRIWAGAGFTGQPLLVKEKGTLYIIQGAFDHHLKKINAVTGKLEWQYAFDDIIRGTGTLYINPNSKEKKDQVMIFQGSRLGNRKYLDSKNIPSFRAVSYYTGQELWRFNVKRTDSYSRDADGSPLVINDTLYAALENSLLTIMDPDYRKAEFKDNMVQPKVYGEHKLYTSHDVIDHNHNIVTESSPTLLGNMLYIPSGSGHVWGFDIFKKKITWDFYIGSDIDGSAPLTNDKCLLVPIEKQYIDGKGGVFKLDPSKKESDAVVWYFPTQNKEYSNWKGGVIGSPAVNDRYPQSKWATLAAFVGIDGYLYVVNHTKFDEGSMVLGPDANTYYDAPSLVFKRYVGPGISTPIFVEDKLIVATYNGLHLFSYDKNMNFILLDKLEAPFEATPVAHDGKIYVASRNGSLYCLGE